MCASGSSALHSAGVKLGPLGVSGWGVVDSRSSGLEIVWLICVKLGPPGAPGWDRTTDQRFRRPLLYPLSYGRGVDAARAGLGGVYCSTWWGDSPEGGGIGEERGLLPVTAVVVSGLA